MMEVKLRMKGVGEIEVFKRIMAQIPKKQGPAILKRSADFLQRSMKAQTRASDRWAASGKLSRSIKVKLGDKRNQLVVSVDARSGEYQEFGFRPHYVPISYLSKRAIDAMKTYSLGSPKKTGHGKKGLIFVTKSKPFVKPAVERLDKRIDRIIDEELDKVIK